MNEFVRKTSRPLGPQEARRLGHPEGRIGPQRGAELGDGKVERRVRQRHALAGRLDEREA